MLRDSGYCDNFCDTGGGGGSSNSEPICALEAVAPPICSSTNRRPVIPQPLIKMGTEQNRHPVSPPPLTPLSGPPDRSNMVDDGHKDSRVTGPSCRALRHAVSGLNRLDDFSREKIGSGFFSEVFKVTHRVTGDVMVLKMNILGSNRPNMLKEVQLMNQLSHQNILGFMGVCVHEGQLHALTEYINGGSLEQLIQSRNLELTYSVRMKLALDIAKGMEYLHSREVFHRDLTSKNVLIKKNESTGEMTAVVGDFGLAAKIPRAGHRLPTVGSPYWMSPECLKGQWYDQSSDVFSYGIILCELIARIEADPDVLPRTKNFGLDYLAFIELCSDPPPEFLKLAFSCCNFEPKNRPTFTEIVRMLERSMESLVINNRSVTGLPSSISKSSSTLGARSEEVLPTEGSFAPQQANCNRKLVHRRSLSEDVGMVVFPPHTAPSDKARCHFLSNNQLKHVGEAMAREDPYYKPFPSKANPFKALGQLRGVKILASTNSTDLFSSCFELPSPSLYKKDSTSNIFDPGSEIGTTLSTPILDRTRHKSNLTDNWKIQMNETICTEPSIVIESVVKPSNIEISKSIQNVRDNIVKKEFDVSKDLNKNKITVETTTEITVTDAKVASNCFESILKSACSDLVVEPPQRSITSFKCKLMTPVRGKTTNSDFWVEQLRYSTHLIGKPALSLPSSPTFSRRGVKSESSKSSEDDETGDQFEIASHCLRKKASSLFAHPLFKNREGYHDELKRLSVIQPLRTCSSSSNIPALDDISGSANETAVSFFNHHGHNAPIRRRGSCESGFYSNHGEDFCLPGVEMVTASSVTLSSSSAASSLFLDSGATVSCSLEDIATPLRGHSTPVSYHNNQHKRSSSVYTDSSEDVSSLGGSDLANWDDRNLLQAPQQQISKIVEYFERKQSNLSIPSSSSSTGSFATNQWDSPDQLTRYHLQREYYQLRRCYLQEQQNRGAISGVDFVTGKNISYKRGINQRLMICEGAVRSKLPLFDKKINSNSKPKG